jgi:hypothetical protein
MGYGHHHEHEGGHGHSSHGGHGHHGRGRGREHGYAYRGHEWGGPFGGECGPGYGLRGFGFRGLNREEWLARLEEYQKDLEQRVADVADIIRRLREGGAAPEQPTETTTV